MDYIGLFPKGVVKHGSVAHSDHVPIWLDSKGGHVPFKGNKPFKFESMCLGNKACNEIIEDVWRFTPTRCNLDQLSDFIQKYGIV